MAETHDSISQSLDSIAQDMNSSLEIFRESAVDPYVHQKLEPMREYIRERISRLFLMKGSTNTFPSQYLTMWSSSYIRGYKNELAGILSTIDAPMLEYVGGGNISLPKICAEMYQDQEYMVSHISSRIDIEGSVDYTRLKTMHEKNVEREVSQFFDIIIDGVTFEGETRSFQDILKYIYSNKSEQLYTQEEDAFYQRMLKKYKLFFGL